MRYRTNIGNAFAGLFLLWALWYGATAYGMVNKIYLPTPHDAFDALLFGFREGELGEQALQTTLRMLWGWLLASLIAIALGALLGIWSNGRAYLNPILEFLRPLPASAVMPVAIVFFGLTPAMVTGVIAFGSLWPTLLATVHGFSSVEPRLWEVATVLGLSRMQFTLKIGLLSAVPDILSGMRLSLTVALILSIVGEMLTGQPGLGTAILMAGRSYQSSDLFAGIIVLGAIGLVTNAALHRIELHLLRWKR